MLSSPRRRASAGPTPSTRASKGQTPLSVKVALKRAPFILFAKDVPDHLPAYDPARDFSYFYANDMMSLWTGLSPAELTSGHNAASACFDNYERLFQADAEVALDYHFPLVKTIIEGWQPPIMSSYVNMRKTLVGHGSMRWVIGCGAPFDDLEIGIASFRASKLPPPFQPLGNVPDEFYNIAYAELPQACFMLADMESPFILGANEYAHALQHESGTDMANVSEHGDPRTSRVSSGASVCLSHSRGLPPPAAPAPPCLRAAVEPRDGVPVGRQELHGGHGRQPAHQAHRALPCQGADEPAGGGVAVWQRPPRRPAHARLGVEAARLRADARLFAAPAPRDPARRDQAEAASEPQRAARAQV